MKQYDKKTHQIDSSKDLPSMNFEQELIVNWLKKVRFRKKLLGGVSELDVWKKINHLNNMYNTALRAERVRYDALLEQAKLSINAELENEGGI